MSDLARTRVMRFSRGNTNENNNAISTRLGVGMSKYKKAALASSLIFGILTAGSASALSFSSYVSGAHEDKVNVLGNDDTAGPSKPMPNTPGDIDAAEYASMIAMIARLKAEKESKRALLDASVIEVESFTEESASSESGYASATGAQFQEDGVSSSEAAVAATVGADDNVTVFLFSDDAARNDPDVVATPIPASILLMLAGLATLVGLRRKKA